MTMLKHNKKKKVVKERHFSRLSYIGTGQEQELMLENLVMLLLAGVGINHALESIKSDVRAKPLKLAIVQMQDDIDNGSTLAASLEKTKLFPVHIIALLAIGEETGQLSGTLKLVAEYQRKQRAFTSKIRSAMMYPAFVFGLTGVVGIGVAWFILPRLSTVFSSLNLELPAITKVLIGTGLLLQSHGVIIVPALIVVMAVLVYVIFIYKRTKFIGQAMLLKFPGIKKLVKEVELSRFGYMLGTLMASGISITQSLESLVQASSINQYTKFYKHLATSVPDGESFADSFSSYKKLRKLVPSPVQQLIISGEQSGHLSDSLLSVARSYEEKTDLTSKNLAVLLEPVLLVIVWIGVVLVALAVILPLYSLLGNLNAGPQNIETPPAPTQPIEVSNEPIVPQIQELEPEDTQTVVVSSEATPTLNVRDNPADGEVIGTVIPGQELSWRSEVGGWFLIELPDGSEGWVSGDFVEAKQ